MFNTFCESMLSYVHAVSSFSMFQVYINFVSFAFCAVIDQITTHYPFT